MSKERDPEELGRIDRHDLDRCMHMQCAEQRNITADSLRKAHQTGGGDDRCDA